MDKVVIVDLFGDSPKVYDDILGYKIEELMPFVGESSQGLVARLDSIKPSRILWNGLEDDFSLSYLDRCFSFSQDIPPFLRKSAITYLEQDRRLLFGGYVPSIVTFPRQSVLMSDNDLVQRFAILNNMDYFTGPIEAYIRARLIK